MKKTLAQKIAITQERLRRLGTKIAHMEAVEMGIEITIDELHRLRYPALTKNNI